MNRKEKYMLSRDNCLKVINNLTLCIPLSLKDEGEVFLRGAKPSHTLL